MRIALLEAGAAWGTNVLTHLVDRFEKRGNDHVQQYNPANIDRQLIIDLYRQHGQELFKGREYSDDQIIESVFGVASAFRFREQKAEDINDFALAKIQNKQDIFDRWVPNFYFGNEADDRTIVGALHPQATPFNQKVNALFSSDSGHWDVPELTEPLAETWDLVQEGAITAEDFKALVLPIRISSIPLIIRISLRNPGRSQVK